MKNKFLKSVCFSIILTMAFSMLTGCKSNKDDNQTSTDYQAEISSFFDKKEKSERTENEEKELKNETKKHIQDVAIVNGDAITFDEFGYYVLNQAVDAAYSKGASDFDIANFDWNQETEEGVKLYEKVISDALDVAEKDILTLQKADELNITLSEEDKNAVDTYINELGEEYFQLTANAMAIPSVEVYKALYNKQLLVQKVQEEISSTPDRFIDNSIDYSKYQSDDIVSVQHILIMNDTDKTDSPESLAESIQVRAKNGEDFLELMHEFNEDPGETDAGYTFGPGEMVPEFEYASFELGYNEISEVVVSDYGYHIIKRLIGIGEIQSHWKESATIEVNSDLYKKISVKDIIKKYIDATEKIQAYTNENGGNKNE